MRTGITLTMSALLLPGATAWAQRPDHPCQAEEVAVARSKVLAQALAVAPQQLEAAQNALAQCQAMQAQLATKEARLAELRAAEAALRAQQATLSARGDAREQRL